MTAGCRGTVVARTSLRQLAAGAARHAARAALPVTLVLASLAPGAADAQPATGVPRIGYLVANLAAGPRAHEAFRQGLRELGRVEGRDVVIEYRSAEGHPERLPALAAELVSLKVDVIVTGGGTPAALAAQQATKAIPVVAVAVGDPVTSGLVTSLARPGGNVTGLALLFPELVGKCLEQLKQAVPRVGRVAVLVQPGAVPERTYTDIVNEAERAARALGLGLRFVEARDPADLDRAFSEMVGARVDGLAVLSTNMFFSARDRLAALARRHRLPAVFSFSEYVDAGGLLSYGPHLPDLSRRAAAYVDRILKGARPGDLPVEQPTKFELVVNLKTAKALGLTLSPSLLGRAERMIQ